MKFCLCVAMVGGLLGCSATAPQRASQPAATSSASAEAATEKILAPALTVEIDTSKESERATASVNTLLPEEESEELVSLVVEKPPIQLRKGGVVEAACYETRGYLKYRLGEENGAPAGAKNKNVKAPAIDIDGDGKPDRLIEIGASGVAFDVLVLLVRERCVIPVGRVSAFDVISAKGTFHHGLRDLHSTSQCEESFSCEVDWEFDGKAYVQTNPKPSKRKPMRAILTHP